MVALKESRYSYTSLGVKNMNRTVRSMEELVMGLVQKMRFNNTGAIVRNCKIRGW